MEKYILFTWPDSQEFVSNPLCFLVCPPDDEADPTRLDSSYMVPIQIADPSDSEKIYVRLDETESKEWIDKTNDEDDVLFDYDGMAFIEENLYLKSRQDRPEKPKKLKIDVQIIRGENGNLWVLVDNWKTLFEFDFRDDAWLFWLFGERCTKRFDVKKEKFPMDYFIGACKAKYFLFYGILPDKVEVSKGKNLISK